MARLVACKMALAARTDSFRQSLKGEHGMILLNEIKRRLDKLQEPPPVKNIKPLPIPSDSGKKQRGGKRYRKMKERRMSEFRKEANRTIFGKV